ncbi:MAG: tetratricopeptide repeat protein [Acidobacteria bacterium]|nr:tetratricopeptide repeat protein [Acidobacteriota bacterium]
MLRNGLQQRASLCAYALACLAAWGGHARGAAPSQAVESLVNIRFVADVRVFSVMAALNAAGFDLDAGQPEANPAREILRKGLAGLDPPLRDRLRDFCAARRGPGNPVDEQGRYVSFALLLRGPPGFERALADEDLPADAAGLRGFELLLRELWAEGTLERLWQELRPLYAQEAEEYRPLIRDTIVETLGYLRTPARVSLDRRVTFIPDLLNAFGVVNARNVDEDYFVVVGPSRKDTRLVASVRHEYLHFLLDPLVAKYAGSLPESRPFLDQMDRMPGVHPPYRQSFSLMVRESLVRAVEGRLGAADETARTVSLVENYEKGLILSPYFDDALAAFEGGTGSVVEAVPAWIEGIRWEAESGRAGAMAQRKEEVAAAHTPAPVEQRLSEALQPTPVRGMLAQANELLQARRFEEAEPVLRAVLGVEEANAGALFGLAQIAARRGQWEQALELYGRAAANAREQAWIAAWSLVHRGLICMQLDDPARAKEQWNQVLELEGDLRGAREAADKALRQLSHPPPPEAAALLRAFRGLCG